MIYKKDISTFLNAIVESYGVAYVLFFILLVYSLFMISVSITQVDAGYFLSISRDMVEMNKLPIRDIHTAYTPLSYFFYAIVFLIFKNPPIVYFYIFNLFIGIICTVIFSQAIAKIKLMNPAWASLLFFVIINPLFYDIKLELFVVLFASTAFYFIASYIKTGDAKWLFFAGIFIGFSTLSKQYALLLLPSFAIMLFYFTGSKHFLKTQMTLGAGFLFTLIVYYLFYVHVAGTEPSRVFLQFIGENNYVCADSYGIRNYQSCLTGLFRYAMLKTPIFLIIIPWLSFLFFLKNDKTIMTYLALLFLYMLPFYFQVYPHYFYFGFLPLLVIIINFINKEKTMVNAILKYILFVPIAVSIYSCGSLCTHYSRLRELKTIENNFYHKVGTFIPKGSTGFIENKKQIYFENDIKSIDLYELSYSFVGINYLYEAIDRDRINGKDFYYFGSRECFKIDGYELQNAGQIKGEHQNEHYFIHYFKKINKKAIGISD